MLLDLKNLSANLEDGQSKLIDRLDHIVRLLQTLIELETSRPDAPAADRRPA